MHKILTAALMLTLAAASASAVSQAAAKPIPRAAANADREQSAPELRLLHYIEKVDPNGNTDIDLGAPGLSAGNQQVFRDRLYQHGRLIGYAAGVAQVVALTPTTLTAQVVSTATVPGGTLTTQFAFTETLADGPPAVLHIAITGGTGAYRYARGQCQSKFLNDADDASVTCTLRTNP
jgi:hypothetical protein